MAILLVTALSFLQHRAASSGDGPDHASAAPAGPDYSFLRVNPSGTPTRWNPCQAIHFRTNLAEAPPAAAADLGAAIGQVSSATGLTFVDDGSTTVIPTKAYESGANGHHPVVIAWATPAQTDVLAPGALDRALGAVREVGVGGASAVIDPVTGHGVYVSGLVVIDPVASAGLNPGFGPHSIGVVLMHELGHLVGLGHTTASDEIMNPVVQTTKDGSWGPGDMAGLARLGVGSGCLSVPKRRTVLIY
ncbi:MAG TPA: matrixin family metalloprotease [Acidimicrobiales bacterium]